MKAKLIDHEGRDRKYKQSEQLMIEVYGITDTKINSDPQNPNNRLINQIYMHKFISTKKQDEKSTKKSLIDDLSKQLLRLEFKSNNSIKSKCLKWIVKRILPEYKR